MDFSILLGLSIIVCVAGVAIRLTIWFTQGFQPSSPPVATGRRVSAAAKGLGTSLFGVGIVQIIKSFFLDLILQKRVLDKSLLRWVAHALIFFGFVLLFFMHALDGLVSENLFSNYYSTLNPYLFLRNLFGIMVLAGVGLAVYRRITWKPLRLKNAASDWAALIFVAVIILSGMLLEGSKMASYTTYQRMTEEYGAYSDDEEELALEAFWVAENGLQSPNILQTPTAEMIELGREVNSYSCIECHSSNKTAFASYSLSFITPAFAAIFGDSGAVTMFWYLHILTCLAFLAWLPFSKMFHIFSAPVSLITKRVTGDEYEDPANVLNRQMMGLSACTHCGSCSVECSASMFFESFGNDFILPSEKVQHLKRIAAGDEKDPEVIKRMQEGLYVCTSCDRCTMICPSGINLKEIFVSARYSLLTDGQAETTLLSHFSFPLALAQNFVDDHLKALRRVTDIFKQRFKHLADVSGPIRLSREQGIGNTTFKSCYSCQRCSNICPVVRSYDDPLTSLGMLPHQIIYSLGIGDTELAMGAQMIWSCSTCYLCQEHCPNQVELCDIFYTLKNGALTKIEAGGKA